MSVKRNIFSGETPYYAIWYKNFCFEILPRKYRYFGNTGTIVVGNTGTTFRRYRATLLYSISYSMSQD